MRDEHADTAAELLAERRAKGLTAADIPKSYPGYAYDYPAPEQRVRRWVDLAEEIAPGTDVFGWLGGEPLYMSDLRDVLNELDEAISLLGDIDAVVSSDYDEHTMVENIRDLLGNNTGRIGR